MSLYNKNNNLIDKCVIVYYKGPKSFTGDDMVEIHTHGNPVIIDTVSKALLNLGVRHAEAGEFTRAALLNKKDRLNTGRIFTFFDKRQKHSWCTNF